MANDEIRLSEFLQRTKMNKGARKTKEKLKKKNKDKMKDKSKEETDNEIYEQQTECEAHATKTTRCCDPITLNNDHDSSGTNEEDYGYFCGICEVFFETLSKLKSHLESECHKEAEAKWEGDTELKYDRHDSQSSCSDDGFEKCLDDDEVQIKYFREYFCRRQGFGFDCNQCCKRKNRNIDRTVSNTSFKELKTLIDDAAKVKLEPPLEVQEPPDNWDCESDGSSLKAVRNLIRDPNNKFGERFGTKKTADSSGSEDTDEECLWNRLYEKPNSKECKEMNAGKYVVIKHLDPVDKLMMIPKEEGETIHELNDGYHMLEKIEGNNITLRVVQVESLKGTTQDSESCCQ